MVVWIASFSEERDTLPSARVSIGIEAAVTKHSNERATDNYTLTFRTLAVRSRGDDKPRRVLRRSEEFLFKRTAGRGRRIAINGDDISFIKEDDEVDFRTSLREGSLGLQRCQDWGPIKAANK